jgi:hypothetical protein
MLRFFLNMITTVSIQNSEVSESSGPPTSQISVSSLLMLWSKNVRKWSRTRWSNRQM